MKILKELFVKLQPGDKVQIKKYEKLPHGWVYGMIEECVGKTFTVKSLIYYDTAHYPCFEVEENDWCFGYEDIAKIEKRETKMEEQYTTYVKAEGNDEIITEPVDIFDYVSRDTLRKAQHEIRRLESNNARLSTYFNQRDDDNKALIRALSRTYADVEEERERGTHFQELNSHKSELLWTIKLKCRSLIGDSKPVADGEEESELVKFAKEILDIAEEVL